jgi:hypothetical protein
MTVPTACICRSTDARRCYEIRYPAPMDDFQRADYFAQLEEDDSQCECGCHEDEYPEDFLVDEEDQE